MPTYILDESFFEEYQVLLNEDEFTRDAQGRLVSRFEDQSAVFQVEQLDGSAQHILSELLKVGAECVFCRYDGGGDEGFAHFESALVHGEQKNVLALAPLLPSLEQIAPEEQDDESYVVFLNCYFTQQQFEQLEPVERVKMALDHLAYGLATQLLGDGYGTGVEGSMFGAFRADLNNGAITDEICDAPDFGF